MGSCCSRFISQKTTFAQFRNSRRFPAYLSAFLNIFLTSLKFISHVWSLIWFGYFAHALQRLLCYPGEGGRDPSHQSRQWRHQRRLWRQRRKRGGCVVAGAEAAPAEDQQQQCQQQQQRDHCHREANSQRANRVMA